MQRITSSGATVDGRFKESPAPATRLTAGFLNSVLDELTNVVTNPLGGNAALNPADNGQLLAAILAAVGRALPVAIDAGQRSVNIGGFIVKLGSVAGPYSESTVYTPFPTQFPTDCWGAFSLARNDTGSVIRDLWTQGQGAPTVNGFYTRVQWSGGNTTQNLISGFDWVAFGI